MDTKRLDLNLLATLEILLVEQNVTKAAARLNLSQPAVSAQLSRLRDLFNDPLFIPARRGLTPTAKALELLEPVRDALDRVRATVASHVNFEPGIAKLAGSIACTDYLQEALIRPLMYALRTAAPGIRIAVNNLDIPRLHEQMERGDIDIALMTPQAAPPNLRTRHLFEERYVMIARRDNPHVRDTVTLSEFVKLEHVIVSLRGGDFDTPVDRTLAALGLERNVVLSASAFLFVPKIVAQSDFVALVPERLVRNSSDGLKILEPPLPVEGFDVALVWHERTHEHGGQRWLRQMIISIAGPSSSQRQ